METVLSGVDEASCREAFAALDQGECADWWPSARLLEEVQRKASDFTIIWFYGSPAWVASRVQRGESIEAALDAWIRRNRAILNLRGVLGARLKLVNIEVVAGFGGGVHAQALYGALLGWWGPTYQGVYEVLEAAAWRPLGAGSPRSQQPGEQQLLATIEGYVEEVRQAWEAGEASKADAMLARLQETQEDLETVLMERDRLRSELSASQQERDEHALACKQLKRQLQEAEKGRRQLRALTDRLAAAEAELERARQELHASVAKRDALDKRVATEVEAGRKLRAELATSKESHARLDHRFACMQRDYSVLRGEHRELKARNIEAMRQLRDLALVAERDVPAAPASGASLRQGVVRLIPGLRRRQPDPSFREREESIRLISASDWFDRDWYLTAYPDVAAAGLDPVTHYLDFGWKEFRNPGPNFDTTYYLTNNIDVAKSGLNPLVHFIKFGSVEGRQPQQGVRNA